MKYIFLILVVFCLELLNAPTLLYSKAPELAPEFTMRVLYKSDRDNVYSNGFISSMVIHDNYIYPLLDTGDVGVLKMFKVPIGVKKTEQSAKDDSIKWSLYFGNENERYLREANINFLTANNTIRLCLLQRINEFCQVRVIDVSLDGQILSNNLLDFRFDSSAKIARVSDNVFAVAYTQWNEAGNEVKVVRFNTDSEIINSASITDESGLLEVNNLKVAENGDIAVISMKPSFSCYWKFILTAFDKDMVKIISYEDSFWDVPLRQMVIGRSYNKNWVIEFPYNLPSDSNSTIFSRAVRLECSKTGARRIKARTEFEENKSLFKYIILAEPGEGIYFRIGSMYMTSGKCTVLYDQMVNVNCELIDSEGAGMVTRYLYVNNLRMVMTSYSQVNDTTYCVGLFHKDSIAVSEYKLMNVTTSVSVNEAEHRSKNICSYFSGDFARVLLSAEDIGIIANIVVYDFMGNKVMDIEAGTEGGEFSIPIANLPNGLYLYYVPSMNIKGKFGVSR